MKKIGSSFPARWPGTTDEKRENYQTHDWSIVEPEEPMECNKCGVQSYGSYSEWPCGARVPRIYRYNSDMPEAQLRTYDRILEDDVALLHSYKLEGSDVVHVELSNGKHEKILPDGSLEQRWHR